MLYRKKYIKYPNMENIYIFIQSKHLIIKYIR